MQRTVVTVSCSVAKEASGGKIDACLCQLLPAAVAVLLEQQQLEAAALR